MKSLRLETDSSRFSTALYFKVAVLLFLVAVCYAAAPHAQKLSAEEQKIIGPNSVARFTSDGEFKQMLRKLEDREARSYESLEDFVTKNPIDNCKHPTPSPPCVICEDGTEVCSNAPFPGGAKKEKY